MSNCGLSTSNFILPLIAIFVMNMKDQPLIIHFDYVQLPNNDIFSKKAGRYSYMKDVQKIAYSLTHISEKIDSNLSSQFINDQATKGYLTCNRDLQTETSLTYQLETDFLHAENVYANGYSVFGNYYSIVSLRGVDTSAIVVPARCSTSVQHAIALSHYYFAIGAIFYNFAFPLMGIPRHLWNISTFLIPPGNTKYFTDLIHIICGRPVPIIELKAEEFVFASNFYTIVNPIPGISHYGTMVKNFSILMRERLHLDVIIPTKYGLCNRNPKYRRSIKNFDDVVSEAKKRIPQHDWTIVEDYENFLDAAKVFASLKVVLIPTGSNVVKVVLMPPKSAICLVFGDRFDWEAVAVALTADLFCYSVACSPMKHFQSSNNVINVDQVISALNSTVYAADHGHWSKETLEANKGMIHKYSVNPG